MVQKVFATKSGRASFSCPECGKIKQLDISRFNRVDKQVRLKCTCTCKLIFPVILERRKRIRRPVDLSGVLFFNNKRYSVKIVDISRSGLKIKTNQTLDLKVQDCVVIEFVLDDESRSKVSKEVVIKKSNETQVGVEFLSHDHYDRLGPYLLFHFN